MPSPKCAACGFERREHHYNGACYGVCGDFIASAEDRRLHEQDNQRQDDNRRQGDAEKNITDFTHTDALQ